MLSEGMFKNIFGDLAQEWFYIQINQNDSKSITSASNISDILLPTKFTIQTIDTIKKRCEHNYYYNLGAFHKDIIKLFNYYLTKC